LIGQKGLVYSDPLYSHLVSASRVYVHESRGQGAYGKDGEKLDKAQSDFQRLKGAYKTEGLSERQARDKATQEFKRIRTDILDTASQSSPSQDDQTKLPPYK
jgi:hypothetical protein